MDYTLAKELKDAGFPQSDEWEVDLDEPTVLYKTKPTLEELIDACEVCMLTLQTVNGIEWQAIAFIYPHTSQEKMYIVQGKTPLEAVAKLWLALNSKNVV